MPLNPSLWPLPLRCALLIALAASCFACAGFQIPPPPGTLTPSPTAPPLPTRTYAGTPFPTLAPTPSPQPQPTIASSCVDDTDPSHSKYIGRVRWAMQTYISAHPDQFDGAFFKFDSSGTGPSQDVFFNGIISLLAPYGLSGYIDTRGGDLAIASSSTLIGYGFAETFHPLSSWDPFRAQGRLVQSAPFIGICQPRWF